ncbi:MAG: type VI secretion system baseplate subunit TssE [bacterium]|nr:type VI secretion system baseplate subunit TssE [bacterium]
MSTWAVEEKRFSVPLFDRLCDDDLKASSELTPLRTYSRTQTLKSIEKEISRLLNTRRDIGIEAGKKLDEVIQGTVLDYGFIDFASIEGTALKSWRGVASSLKEIIEKFEPRLMEVQIDIAGFSKNKQSLNLGIGGRLKDDPAGEKVNFPIVLQDVLGGSNLTEEAVA